MFLEEFTATRPGPFGAGQGIQVSLLVHIVAHRIELDVVHARKRMEA